MRCDHLRGPRAGRSLRRGRILRPTSVSNGWLERFGLVTWRGVTRGGGSVVVLAAVVVLFGRCVGSGCRAGGGAGGGGGWGGRPFLGSSRSAARRCLVSCGACGGRG